MFCDLRSKFLTGVHYLRYCLVFFSINYDQLIKSQILRSKEFFSFLLTGIIWCNENFWWQKTETFCDMIFIALFVDFSLINGLIFLYKKFKSQSFYFLIHNFSKWKTVPNKGKKLKKDLNQSLLRVTNELSLNLKNKFRLGFVQSKNLSFESLFSL